MKKVALVSIALVACSPGGAATPDGGEGGASAASSCPSVPASGAPCAAAATCTYGGAGGRCATLAQCSGGVWQVTPPAVGCGTNDPSCPASFAALAQGSACPVASGQCVYPEGVCACTPCRGDAGPSSEWSCRGFVTAGPDCPTVRPPLGSACSVEDAFCAWSCCQAISLGPDETCAGGVWTPGTCTAFCQATPACL